VAVILAVLSSVLWGIADFSGGTASRRLPSLLVVMVSQAAGLAAAAVAAGASGEWRASLGYLPWAVGAGLVGATGLLMYYRALAIGTMGVVSPIAALSVIIPVAVGLVSGHLPSAIVGAGIVLAVLGVMAASGPERAHGRSLRPVLLAIVAAVCFGATLLFIARGAAHSPLMTMVGMRVASVLPLAAICLARRRALRAGIARTPGSDDAARRRSWARLWLLVVVAGLFDVSANLAFAEASTRGALAIVAILGSLYPAVTVLLARVVHGERLTRLQQAGVALALVGVALIAGWS
jgi:drug/metabolite transporter (DMT)-like permease